MMLLLSIILIVFLGLSVIVMTGALCALCLGFYEDIYKDTDYEQKE
jgi:hypothetical protein